MSESLVVPSGEPVIRTVALRRWLTRCTQNNINNVQTRGV
jgi:hypothetical protein